MSNRPDHHGFEVVSPTANDTPLCDVLDRLLDTGVVLRGDVIIKVADIELVYLGLQAVLASVETMRGITDASVPDGKHT